MNIFKKIYNAPRQAVDAIMRRKMIAAAITAVAAVAATYGFDLAPDAQKALIDFFVAISS
jgi:hypothetical protein